MLQGKSKFIKLLEQKSENESQNIDPLTATITASCEYSIRQEVSLLLKNINDQMGIVSVLGHSCQFFEQIRVMLFGMEWEKVDKAQKQMVKNQYQIYLYGKIQIGATKEGKPIEWIYTEMKIKTNSTEQLQSPIRLNRSMLNLQVFFQKTIEFNLLVSSFIIFQIIDEVDFKKIAKECSTFFQKIKKCNILDAAPTMLLVYSQKRYKRTETQIQTEIKQFFQLISYPLHCIRLIPLIQGFNIEKLEINEQRQLMTQGRVITNSMRTKILGPIYMNTNAFIHFTEYYFHQQDSIEYDELIRQTRTKITQQLANQAATSYLNKFAQFTQQSSAISHQLFQQIHEKVKFEIMKQLLQRIMKIIAIKRVKQVQNQLPQIKKANQKILQIKTLLQNKNNSLILLWGKEILQNQYLFIDKKILKDIKSINSYKQQISVFIQFYKKKTEKFMTQELSIYFYETIINKIFESTLRINSHQVSLNQQKINQLENKNITLNNENRELKKKSLKQEIQYQRKIQQLSEKLISNENKNELLYQSVEKLNEQIQEIIQRYENKLTSISEQHYLEIANIRQKNQQLSQFDELRSKQITLLHCQLNKEKLLHGQTQEYYRQMIEDYKIKSEELKNQMSQINYQSEAEIEQMKRSSIRQIEDYQVVKSQIKLQVRDLQKIIKENEQTILKMQNQIQKLKINSDQKIFQLNQKILQVELRNKLLEDKQFKCQILEQKVKKLQQQIKKIEQDRERSYEDSKNSQKISLITQQRLEYTEQSLHLQKQKVSLITYELEASTNKIEQLQSTVAQLTKRIRNKIMVDQWVQATDQIYKDKLKLALETIEQLQKDYLRIKAEYSILRYKKY